MKYILFILTFTLATSIAFAFAHSNVNNETLAASTENEAAALWCTKTCPDGTSYTCYICYCSSLPDCAKPGID